MPKESDSDEIQERDEYWQVKYKLRALERANNDLKDTVKDYEKRIRSLEDYKLTATDTHKKLVRLIGILASVIAGIVSIAEHLIFK